MPEIPIPKPNSQPEAPLIRTSEPKAIIRNTSKEPTKAKVYVKEPTFKEKLRRSFVKEDLKSVRDYIIFDVLIPNVKKSLFDMITGAVGQTLGVQIPKATLNSITRSSSSGYGSGYRDYTVIGSRSRDVIRERNELRYDRYRIRDLVFASREEAMSLLELLIDICDQRHAVSVFLLFEKAGIREGNHFTNKDWGWRNLNNAGIIEVEMEDLDAFPNGIGYILDLPEARPI